MQTAEQAQGTTLPIREESRHDWRAPKRARVLVGRVTGGVGQPDLFPGKLVVGRHAMPHPLHGHLKKIVLVKIPAEGGYYLKYMKLKTALQKGYYKVNTTDTKTKAAIEKSLEPFKPKANA